MSGIFLAFPVLFPIAAGALMIAFPVENRRRRNLLVEAVTLITSLVVFWLLFTVRTVEDGFTLYRLT